MDERDYAGLIRGFYASFDSRPYEISIAPFLADEVVWHVAGDNPLAGTFVGVDAVLVAMRRYADLSGDSLRLDTRTVLADDHHVVAIHYATASVRGFAYHAHEVDVFHVNASVIFEFWSFSEDQVATDRLWSLACQQQEQ